MPPSLPIQGSTIPVIDIQPLITGIGDLESVAAQINHACCKVGFFYIAGHGVDERLQ